MECLRQLQSITGILMSDHLEKACVVSTSHIDYTEAYGLRALIEQNKLPGACNQNTFFIPVNCVESYEEAGFDSLIGTIYFAMKYDAEWLILDAAGKVHEQLPQFNW